MTNDDEDPSVFNGYLEIEAVVDRPVAQVWKMLVDVKKWVTSHHIEYVYGKPGTLGSIKRISFKKAGDLGYPPPHHHFCKTFLVIQERQYVDKTYSERGGSYGMQMTAFDDFRVFPFDGKTKIIVTFFCDYRGETVAKDAAAMARSLEASREGMVKNLDNLRRILESQPRIE